MPTLTIYRKRRKGPAIPYWVFVNNQPVGIMKGQEVLLQMPAGEYDIEVRVVFSARKPDLSLGGRRRISLAEHEAGNLTVTDKERWWNILFDVDLVLWVVEFFVTLPHPLHIIYEVVSNGFFAIWLLRLWIIRKRYFVLEE